MAEVFYECQRCGNCCRWPGLVRLRQGEPERLAAFLGIDTAEFVNRFTTLTPDRTALTLVSKPNHECIFLEGRNVCQVQAVKPAQCAGFPNTWNFPGWREVCEALPRPPSSRMDGTPAVGDPPAEGLHP